MQIYRFSLELENRKIVSIFDHQKNKTIPSFYKPLTSSDYKIYVLTNQSDILYIGTSKQSIRTRLNLGLKAKGTNGYHGYKWKDFNEVELNTVIFNKLDKTQVEAVEAELAFLVRSKTGKWPLKQNEIHFNNEYSKATSTAEEIFEKIVSPQNQ